MGAPWAQGGPWAQAPGTLGPKKTKEILKMGGFFEHGKDARRNSVPGTVLNNSKSLLWNLLEQIVFSRIGEKVQKY